jgi:hypothetical protein
MHKTKQIIILISLFVVFSALNISNTATTNACWGWRNHKPKLTDGQVNPSQGDQMTLFTYTVNYIDADNDEPIIILVVINCRPYCMHKQDPSDNDYTDGCIYTYSRYLQPGYYDFWFIGTDGYRIVWTPRMYGPTVIGTTPPILSNGQVDPSTGERGLTEFNFSVIYTDAENNPPTFLDITLDGADFTMIKTDPLDCDYTDGCGYYYATSLDVLGTHQFNFSASDGCYCVHSETFLDPTVVDTIAPDLTCSSPLNTTYTSGTIDIIVSSSAIDVDMFWYALYDITNEQWIGYQNGTVITGGHATVDLGSSYYLINVYVNDTAGNINSTEIYFTIANPPVLSAGQVDPSIGEKWLTEFNFSVIYTDEDNSPPIIMNITLDGINYTMDKVNPLDCNYVDGCTYNYITILEELGEHQFKFYTFDDTYWVYSDIFIGPTVQDTIGPDLTCSSPLNTTYTSGTIDIIVSSNAIDVDLFWYTLYDVFNEQWIGYQNGTVITGGHATVDLGSGYYLMNVYVNDTFGNLNSTEIYFTIANPPILSDGQVDPLIGERWLTLFNFSINYSDIDNSPPTIMNITLDGVNYTMIKAIIDDNNYLDGCIYYFATTIEELGEHQFNFCTSDGTYWTYSETFFYPTVQDTTPPDIICSSPMNITYNSGIIDIIVSSSAIDVDLFWYTLYDVYNEQWIGYQNGTVITEGQVTPDLGESYYKIDIYVNDTVGNINTITIYFTVLLYIIVDTIPPDLVCSSPINKTYNAGNIDILVSSSALDVDSFWYTLYCVSCDDWIGDPKGILIESGSASLNLEDGYYIITVFVNDTFGNTNSEEICFTVSIPMMPMFPPELIMIIIGSTLGAGALGTVIIVKRRKSKAQKYHYDKIFDKEKGGMVIFKDKVTKPRKESEVKLEGYKAPPLPPPVKDLLKKELKETNQLKGDSKTVSDKPAD